MTNAELDRARAEEAAKRIKNLGTYGGSLPVYSISAITEAARLTREGWTPPVAVDPDLVEAKRIAENWDEIDELVYAGIKRGRALAAAEAKPSVVWVKHDYSSVPPRLGPGANVATICDGGHFNATSVGAIPDWTTIDYYMLIEWPEDYEQ